jgi:hypothetical protein
MGKLFHAGSESSFRSRVRALMCRGVSRCVQSDNVVFAGAWATISSSGTPTTESGNLPHHITVSPTMHDRKGVRGPNLTPKSRHFCRTTKGEPQGAVCLSRFVQITSDMCILDREVSPSLRVLLALSVFEEGNRLTSGFHIVFICLPISRNFDSTPSTRSKGKQN